MCLSCRKLRQRDSTKFRVQLCIAMALMMVVFIVGIDRTENRYVCISVSALLHYFTLASVLWMGAEALLMFRKIVFVFSQVSKKFIVIVTLTCWCKSSCLDSLLGAIAFQHVCSRNKYHLHTNTKHIYSMYASVWVLYSQLQYSHFRL